MGHSLCLRLPLEVMLAVVVVISLNSLLVVDQRS